MGLRQVLARAATALRLETARVISLSGAVTGSASFDGSSNVNITTTIADAGTSAPPLNIALTDTFSVKDNTQVLFTEMIDVDGMIDIDGMLIEVN